ncbi:hypothetical protein HYX70_00510 [Candidatus Saccharibacteria bacterium]|nr:hypothetical protein [Candidatus Saccharibacteria bacterium]
MKNLELDWDELAFASKKPLKELKATFIVAPREISKKRFEQLVREYLPKGNIVLGISREEFIDGFDGQPHFKALQLKAVQSVVDRVNSSKSPHKIAALHYHQRNLKHILEKIPFQKAILINGSWHSSFHTRPEYYVLVNQGVVHELISPFAGEAEAKAFDKKAAPKLTILYPSKGSGQMTDEQMLDWASRIACRSYDYCFQTGISLGKKNGQKYKPLLATWNKIVPYETFAMHHGASRERNFSPPHDLNHYDTVHAEVQLVMEAQKRRVDLHGTTVFINLLPCPACARMFADTDIAELVYKHDHSEGYAVAMLEAAGKKVRRIVTQDVL